MEIQETRVGVEIECVLRYVRNECGDLVIVGIVPVHPMDFPHFPLNERRSLQSVVTKHADGME